MFNDQQLWGKVLSHSSTRDLLRLAWEEDIAHGDVTTQAIFQEPQTVHARVVSRGPGVACGVPLVAALLAEHDPHVRVTGLSCGERLLSGNILMDIHGDVRSILTAERCVLNFLMRLCGVATATRLFVDQIPAGCKAKIYDTRKTTPGWRLLEKAAVKAGGGENHRMGLFDAVLIKDNHIAAAGSVREALRRVHAHAASDMLVQVEVDTLEQLHEALDAGATLILLDNFTDALLLEAVRVTRGRAVLEASGGLDHDRIACVAATGVDRISVGAITHSAKPLDLSLEFMA